MNAQDEKDKEESELFHRDLVAGHERGSREYLESLSVRQRYKTKVMQAQDGTNYPTK